MAEADLKQFRHKVNQLNEMLNSVDRIPGRRELLVACKNHDEVVELAKRWGFSIGKRWGDTA